MTSQGSAQGRFQRALERRNLLAAEMALREMDHVSVCTALALTLLIGEEAPQRYERAAARWHTRFVAEAHGIGIADAQLALAALAVLGGPGAEAAAATLTQLARGRTSSAASTGYCARSAVRPRLTAEVLDARV